MESKASWLRSEIEKIRKEVWAIESAASTYEEGIVVEALRKDVIDILKKYDHQG